jgi:hypothetical protein
MKTTSLSSIILAFLLPATAPAGAESLDYTFVTTDGAVTITGYRGPGGPAAIPNTIDGLPVTRIADRAFFGCTIITSVSIPGSVTHVGDYAFYSCIRLARADLPEGLTHLGEGVFSRCTSLTDLKTSDRLTSIADWTFYGCSNLVGAGIGNGVTNIGLYAFYSCPSLNKVSLGRGLNHIAWYAFRECTNLASLHFEGNAPTADYGAFHQTTNATVYYRPGTKGWGKSFAGFPAVLWNPQIQSDSATFGFRAGGFGFTITGTPDIPIVVEACTGLGQTPWEALQVCSLTNGLIYFNDLTWTNHHSRFYRIASQ